MKKLLIIGGYGNVGRLLASYLLQFELDFEITLAGRNLEKADETARALMDQHLGKTVKTCRVDAASKPSLIEAMARADLVMVAASSIHYVQNVVEAALETDTDYYDTQLSSHHKIGVLQQYRDYIESRGLVFITDGGYHPGIPGAMIHWARQKLGSLTHAKVYAALKMDWTAHEYTDATVKEMLEEFKSFDPSSFEDGQWKKVSWKNLPKWDFGAPYGAHTCTPMLMEEIKWAPGQVKELKDTGFYISGFNPLMDQLVMPILLLGTRLLPTSWYGPLGRLFKWGLRQGKPPFGVRLVADCKGIKRAMQITVSHQDGYEITVIPVVACLKQYLANRIPPGLHLQAWAVEPEPFFADLQQMGISISVTE